MSLSLFRIWTVVFTSQHGKPVLRKTRGKGFRVKGLITRTWMNSAQVALDPKKLMADVTLKHCIWSCWRVFKAAAFNIVKFCQWNHKTRFVISVDCVDQKFAEKCWRFWKLTSSSQVSFSFLPCWWQATFSGNSLSRSNLGPTHSFLTSDESGQS